MIDIDGKIISRDVFSQKFVCDLSACKGACCVEGDSGAPLEKDEADLLKENFEKIKPFISPQGIEAINNHGTSVIDSYDGELVTPLIEGKECAYTVFDKDGTAKCGIENAYKAGEISFIKPISCHLYPIRLNKYQNFIAVNYHKWPICKPALTCGAKLNVKVYKFLKEPLVRKFGQEFYNKLEVVDNEFFRS
jgi:hypothetical protein